MTPAAVTVVGDEAVLPAAALSSLGGCACYTASAVASLHMSEKRCCLAFLTLGASVLSCISATGIQLPAASQL